jgi:hypothetical protein
MDPMNESASPVDRHEAPAIGLDLTAARQLETLLRAFARYQHYRKSLFAL